MFLRGFFITRTITYIFISVIYLSIFYEIGLLTHNVINYVLLLLQSVLIGNLNLIKHRLFFMTCQGIGPKFRVKPVNEPKTKKRKDSLIYVYEKKNSSLFL